jgi:hypothetical protein
MKLDLRTAVLIRRRLEEAAVPLLFHESKRPAWETARQAARIKRIMGWLGSGGRLITAEYIHKNNLPDVGQGTLTRWGGYAFRPHTHSKPETIG